MDCGQLEKRIGENQMKYDEIQRRYERDGPTTHFATNRTDFVMRQCAPIRVVSRSNANFQKNDISIE